MVTAGQDKVYMNSTFFAYSLVCLLPCLSTCRPISHLLHLTTQLLVSPSLLFSFCHSHMPLIILSFPIRLSVFAGKALCCPAWDECSHCRGGESSKDRFIFDSVLWEKINRDKSIHCSFNRFLTLSLFLYINNCTVNNQTSLAPSFPFYFS